MGLSVVNHHMSVESTITVFSCATPLQGNRNVLLGKVELEILFAMIVALHCTEYMYQTHDDLCCQIVLQLFVLLSQLK